MRRAHVALAAGLTLTALAVALVLTRSPARVTSTNVIPFEHTIAVSPGSASACQAGETLPRETSAIRLSLAAVLGPKVVVEVLLGSHVVARGVRGAGWAGGIVTVHLRPLHQAVSDVTVCFSFRGADERVALWGTRTPSSVAATSSEGALAGRMRIEYLQPGRSSWWSLVLSVARRMGLGRAWAGTWIALLVAALTAAAATLAMLSSARELR